VARKKKDFFDNDNVEGGGGGTVFLDGFLKEERMVRQLLLDPARKKMYNGSDHSNPGGRKKTGKG